MPYLKIETNQQVDGGAIKETLQRISGFVADLLGKPDKWVMVSIDHGSPMMFGGSTEPVAYVEIKSIGLPQDKCPDFSKDLCNFIESEFDVPADRIYIDFHDIDGKMFGWNRGTF
jgi:phenylpyruvate tautomerase